MSATIYGFQGAFTWKVIGARMKWFFMTMMANDIGDGWGLSFPDICLTVEERPRKKSQSGKLTWPEHMTHCEEVAEEVTHVAVRQQPPLHLPSTSSASSSYVPPPSDVSVGIVQQPWYSGTIPTSRAVQLPLTWLVPPDESWTLLRQLMPDPPPFSSLSFILTALEQEHLRDVSTTYMCLSSLP